MIMAQFRTVFKNNEGLVVDTRNYSLDLNAGSVIDWDVTLQVSSPGPTALAPSGWYVVKPGQKHSLVAGLEVNGLNGWDVTRLGWMKIGPKGSLVTGGLQQLVQAYRPRVESCTAGKYEGSFAHGTQIDRSLGRQGKRVTDVHTFLRGVRVWKRHVEMTHKESPLLALTLQHRNKVGVVVQYSSSHLSDFTGVLFQDSFSNLHLEVSLFQASGTITGVIAGSQTSQSILLRLPHHLSNTTRQVKLSATTCRAGQVMVTLSPLSLHNVSITKYLPCMAENMRTFRSAPDMMGPVQATKVEDCLSCGSAWLHWVDPDNWLETSWPQTRIVILVTMVVMGILVILTTCKLVRIICKCCGCTASKK